MLKAQLQIIVFTVFLAFTGSQLIAQEVTKEKNKKEDKSVVSAEKERLQNLPNSEFKMIPPPHFESSSNFNGLVHKGSSTTMQVIEIKGVSYKKVTSSLNASYFEGQGFHLIESKQLQLKSGKMAFIYRTNYSVNNADYERIFFFTGNENTLWINVNYPLVMKPLVYNVVENSLKSVR